MTHLFQPGNQVARKLNTPELCKFAYESYCAHIAKGKSKKSWNLRSPVKLTWETMERYIKESPEVFDPIDKELAWSDGFGIWEQVVEDSAIGRNKEANTASLQMLMRCKYGWDRKDKEQDDDSTALDANEKLLEQLSKLQKKDSD